MSNCWRIATFQELWEPVSIGVKRIPEKIQRRRSEREWEDRSFDKEPSSWTSPLWALHFVKYFLCTHWFVNLVKWSSIPLWSFGELTFLCLCLDFVPNCLISSFSYPACYSPLRPTLFLLKLSIASLNRPSLPWVSPETLNCSHSTGTFKYSKISFTESVISFPIPSPGIKVTV